MSDWIDIGAIGDIPRQGARVVKTAAGCVAIFRTLEDRIFALEDSCPHKAGPLSEGIVHGDKVTCPLHNWVFDMSTGEAQGADEGRVATYATKVEAGRILLDVAFLQKRSAA
ncbi:MAG: nitrite reductase small subunit NirD [Maritimibacter sp.]